MNKYLQEIRILRMLQYLLVQLWEPAKVDHFNFRLLDGNLQELLNRNKLTSNLFLKNSFNLFSNSLSSTFYQLGYFSVDSRILSIYEEHSFDCILEQNDTGSVERVQIAEQNLVNSIIKVIVHLSQFDANWIEPENTLALGEVEPFHFLKHLVGAVCEFYEVGILLVGVT